MSDGALISNHTIRSLQRTSSGGFALEDEVAGTMRVQQVSGGWRIEGDGGLDGWLLVRGEAASARFILLEADGTTEAGRTLPLPGSGRKADLHYLLTSDGCLYRILLRGPRDGRYELQSWEAPGSYLTARPGGSTWTISPEPASSGLREIRPLLILFAAALLDSEELLAEG